jgi:hypothetical protein
MSILPQIWSFIPVTHVDNVVTQGLESCLDLAEVLGDEVQYA